MKGHNKGFVIPPPPKISWQDPPHPPFVASWSGGLCPINLFHAWKERPFCKISLSITWDRARRKADDQWVELPEQFLDHLWDLPEHLLHFGLAHLPSPRLPATPQRTDHMCWIFLACQITPSGGAELVGAITMQRCSVFSCPSLSVYPIPVQEHYL